MLHAGRMRVRVERLQLTGTATGGTQPAMNRAAAKNRPKTLDHAATGEEEKQAAATKK